VNTIEEKIGYLIAKAEEQGTDLRMLSTKVGALEARVDEKFKTAEATFRVLRWVGSTAVAAFAIPWEKVVKFISGL
jgi:hypothetical protein